jgi:hypothetical protein
MSNFYLHGLQCLLAKASTTPVAANALAVWDLGFSYANDVLDRLNKAKRSFGAPEHATARRFGRITFKTPIRVSGVPSTSTTEKEKVLWEAAGFTVSAANPTVISLANDPNGTGLDANFKVYHNGLMRNLTGCRCSKLGIEANAGQLAWYNWEFIGILTDDGSAEAIPADIEDYFPTTKHQPCIGAKFDIAGVTYTGRKYSLNIELETIPTVKHTDTTHGGIGEMAIVNRNFSGQIQIEQPLIATKDFYSDILVNNPTPVALEVWCGVGTDLISKLYAPKAQWKEIQEQNESGIKDLILPFSLRETAGEIDDQFKITLA